MRNLVHINIENAFWNLFLGETVIASLKCLANLETLKQAPGRALECIFMI